MYEGGSSDDIVVGLNEVRDDFNINLYPNPSEADVSVVFDLKNAQTMYAQVIDVRGKLIETIMIHANEGNNTLILDTKGLSQGSYTIKLSGETSASSLPFYKL